MKNQKLNLLIILLALYPATSTAADWKSTAGKIALGAFSGVVCLVVGYKIGEAQESNRSEEERLAHEQACIPKGLQDTVRNLTPPTWTDADLRNEMSLSNIKTALEASLTQCKTLYDNTQRDIQKSFEKLNAENAKYMTCAAAFCPDKKCPQFIPHMDSINNDIKCLIGLAHQYAKQKDKIIGAQKALKDAIKDAEEQPQTLVNTLNPEGQDDEAEQQK